MNHPLFERLVGQLIKLPGVGPRQARRFVYHWLNLPAREVAALTADLQTLAKLVSRCERCRRLANLNGAAVVCPLCADPTRDSSTLLVVEKDIDLENVERLGAYRGRYFVLGRLLPPAEPSRAEHLPLPELASAITEWSKAGLGEVVLALSRHPAGELSTEYLREWLAPLAAKQNFKLSTLGRGLSTGSELEYLDSATLTDALASRRII